MWGSVTGVSKSGSMGAVFSLVGVTGGRVLTTDVGSEASAGAVVGGIPEVVESEVWVPSLPPGLVVVVVSVVSVVTVGAGVVTMAVCVGVGAGVISICCATGGFVGLVDTSEGPRGKEDRT